MNEPVLRLPLVRTRWIWEIEKDYARVLLEVIEVRFTTGGEWAVMTHSLPDAPSPLYIGDMIPGRPDSPTDNWNTLDRFWEACAASPVGGRLEDLSNPISMAQYKRRHKLA